MLIIDTQFHVGPGGIEETLAGMKALGADRIMWASDWSVNLLGETWAELLYSVLGNSDLSSEELELIAGGTAKRFLGWE